MSDKVTLPANLNPEVAAENEGAIQYLLVLVAGREYGIRLDSLQEVLRYNPTAIAPVPNTPGWLEGIYSLRGQIISVVNLRVFLGLASADDLTNPMRRLAVENRELFGIGAEIPRLVVLYSGDLLVGMIVDDLRGVLFVQPDEIEFATAADIDSERFLEGFYTDTKSAKGKKFRLLDARQMITSPELLVFESVLL